MRDQTRSAFAVAPDLAGSLSHHARNIGALAIELVTLAVDIVAVPEAVIVVVVAIFAFHLDRNTAGAADASLIAGAAPVAESAVERTAIGIDTTTAALGQFVDASTPAPIALEPLAAGVATLAAMLDGQRKVDAALSTFGQVTGARAQAATVSTQFSVGTDKAALTAAVGIAGDVGAPAITNRKPRGTLQPRIELNAAIETRGWG